MTDYTGKVAAAVIRYRGSVLIAKRKDNGEWELPGGKQHSGESLRETAEREIKEELNLEAEALKTSSEHSWRGGGYRIVPVLAEPVYSPEIEEEDLTDHTDYRWLEEIDSEWEKKLGDEISGLEAFNL